MDSLTIESFREINVNEPFFGSLKEDYAEFSAWFGKKAAAGENAYVFRNESGAIDGFLYLKVEHGPMPDVTPPLAPGYRIKVGTMKINAHGTKLGERFLKKIFDHAVSAVVDEVYVTVFSKHSALVDLFVRYGFHMRAQKTTTNGTELVLVKQMSSLGPSILQSYPLVQIRDSRIYLLSLKPQWHSRLLPDSILRNENSSIVQDISHTNSIHKVYLAAMNGVQQLRPGDVLVIYRTTDNQGPAWYRSVATSVCVVEEYRHIDSFRSQDDFLRYCEPYSVFDQSELLNLWSRRRYPYVFRFTYNLAMPRRVTRGELVEVCGVDESAYPGFMELSPQQFQNIVVQGRVNESFIVH